MNGLEPTADVSVGDWIAEGLGGPLGTVGSVVPRGFAAYARILHPVEFDDDERPPVTWAEVCMLTGRVPHALMQWAAVVTPAAGAAVVAGPSGIWEDGDVRVGDLAPAALGALIDVLEPATGEQDCFHALWEGWGWVDGSGVAIFSVSDDGRVERGPAPEPGVPAEVWALPRLRLPDRDYLLFRGPLRAALDMGWQGSPLGFEPQSPSLLWPADRSWCVGTEIDFDSTLVGGSADLIAAVLAAPDLEAWPVEPDDDLSASGDLINPAPAVDG
ncbi:hypothetical protein [Nonomuraea africana]|uniref:SMI1/KNR4 family protein n=1 Tax=Nonomuraea africana TaxID=46171 RepID=A0ABR9KQ59_9ACTN|nr:hypothetical protein [Nonomuraea africana]MBE1564170.1 hypothetical protein [Nonomuraea africana]